MMMTCALFGQQGPRGPMMQQRLESQRIAFITEKLQLTPDEATKFWPIYNEYRDKQQAFRRDARPGRMMMEVSDTEAEKIIEEQFMAEENLLKLKKEYYGKLKGAIPPAKIARLAPVEMEFNRTVLEHVRDRMQEH